ncbi:DUF3800 domain-containing protein [Candidatus Saccharibacteria bacterium]|nr:DUF3800 domain-containing protein [Candidatus Saccharibacteria bacterium]
MVNTKNVGKQYIYIDDSGDPGLKGGGSNNFIIASVVLIGRKNRDNLTWAIDEYKKGLGWNEREELKFHKTHKDVIRLAIKVANKYDYSAYAIIIDKSKIGARTLYSVERDSIFLYTIKELLVKLDLSNSDIIIDGARGPKYTKKARTYLRQELKNIGIQTSKISFEDSRSNSLIQLADIVAGSVARSLTNKADAGEYIKLFGHKLKRIFRG